MKDKKSLFRWILLAVGVLLVAYGSIRLGRYLSEMNQARQTTAELREAAGELTPTIPRIVRIKEMGLMGPMSPIGPMSPMGLMSPMSPIGPMSLMSPYEPYEPYEPNVAL